MSTFDGAIEENEATEILSQDTAMLVPTDDFILELVHAVLYEHYYHPAEVFSILPACSAIRFNQFNGPIFETDLDYPKWDIDFDRSLIV